MKRGGDEATVNCGNILDELRGFRWAADYDMQDDVVEDRGYVNKLVARSKQAIKKLDQCEADPARFMAARIKIRNWVSSADGASKGFSLI